MSNISVGKRLLEQFLKFENKEITLSELQKSILLHGEALEGMDNKWHNMINCAEGDCETAIFTISNDEKLYSIGTEIINRLKPFLLKEIPELSNDIYK